MKVYQLMVQAGDVNLLVENTHTANKNTETLLVRLVEKKRLRKLIT
jgi:hypothetical protein